MNELKIKITGTSPLLMHSERGANITDPDVKLHKALTGKRNKTDEDHYAIAHSEFLLAAYADKTPTSKGAPVLPTRNIWKTAVQGGRLTKLGKKLERGTVIIPDVEPLRYSGPKTFEALWNAPGGAYVDLRGVVVNNKRLMRCRPRFNEWWVETVMQFDPSQIDEREILQSFNNAGSYIGIGDFRPECSGKMGRFSVEQIG